MILRAFLLFFIYLPCFAQVSPQLLSKEVQLRLKSVPEFKFIQEEANKLGVKVYLFGGTASAFAHYVRWDLEREAGDDKYQVERFDYDFTNIYRGNQDLDIVVDGTEEDAKALQNLLQEAYPHFIGNKDAWEVRLLKAKMGDKLALLNDQDFKNQHTDTNSTGMIDLTAVHDRDLFKDLLDWSNYNSNFLKDVAAAKITYLFNDNHNSTSRYLEGKNPPIFSAVRYLAKLTQYEVTGNDSDMKLIKKIINSTDWDGLSDYVKYKLEEFGKKVLLNAPDSEYAWSLLEKTGLRKKLIQMDNNQTKHQGSLSWWMSKEPLRSKPLGQGKGRTAREIFKVLGKKLIVSHETKDFQAYENITRSSSGKANVFISRDDINGEAAVYGDGFYTKIGKSGAQGTGLTIRFQLHPDAREKTDFTIESDFLIIKNKKALTLIQENINISLKDYFSLVINGSITSEDLGLLEKMKRKFQRTQFSNEELHEAYNFISENNLFNTHKIHSLWFSIPGSNFFPEVLANFIQIQRQMNEGLDARGKADIRHKIPTPSVSYILGYSHWGNFPHFVEDLIEMNAEDNSIIFNILKKEHWSSRSDWLDIIEKRSNDILKNLIIKNVLSKEYWTYRSDLIPKYLKNEFFHKNIATHILSQKHWADKTEWVETLLKHGTVDEQLITHVFSKPYWQENENFERWINIILKRPLNLLVTRELVNSVLSSKNPNIQSKWVERMIEYSESEDNELDEDIALSVLSNPRWAENDQWLKVLVERNEGSRHLSTFIKEVFTQPHFSNQIKLLEHILNTDEVSLTPLLEILSHPQWSEYTHLIGVILKKLTSYDRALTDLLDIVVENFLSKSAFTKHPEFVEEMIHKGNDYGYMLLAEHILSKKYWAESHPYLLDHLFSYNNKEHIGDYIEKYILVHDYWKHHPQLKAYLDGKSVTLKNLKSKMKAQSFSRWLRTEKTHTLTKGAFTCQQVLQ